MLEERVQKLIELCKSSDGDRKIKGFRWSPEVRDEICELVNQGTSAEYLFHSTRISKKTILRWVELKNPKPKFKEIKIVDVTKPKIADVENFLNFRVSKENVDIEICGLKLNQVLNLTKEILHVV